MINRRQKGNRAKLKTKKYFEKLGYQVFNCEIGKTAFFGGALRIIRQDLCGADLLCLNGKDIIFIQSKSAKGDMLDGKYEFEKYQFPDFVKRWVIMWPARSKEPIILKCEI
jgi:hypothetical protein